MQRKSKIAMIVNFLPDKRNHGGVSYQVHFLAQELSRNFDVTVFSINSCDLAHDYENITIRLPCFMNVNRFLTVTFYPFLIAFQNYEKYDLIHSHGDDFLFFFLKFPIIRTFYGSAMGELKAATSWKRRIHQFFRYLTEFLSGFHARISVSISNSTRKYLPFIDRVIPCGIDLDKFRPGKEKSKNPSILFVGTIRGRKRGGGLVDVFRKQIRPRIHDAELWVVSNEKVEGEGIKWFGRIPESQLIELYQRAWIFCLPSKYEGFGVPYIEALACQTAVVSSPNWGAREVLKNGEYGLITKDDNLAGAIIQLLRNSSIRQKFAQKGLEYVREYSMKIAAERYARLYYGILTSSQK